MKYPTLNLISGAFLIGAILIADSLTLMFCITIYLIILAVSSGRKFRILPNLILLITISFAHTLQPNGLVLFMIGNFPITLGALMIGAKKALLLISFIYASHYMMSSRPHIPGKLGNLLTLQFYYFEKLTTMYRSIEKKRPLMGAIDQLLISVEHISLSNEGEEKEERGITRKDIMHRIFHVLFIYLLLFMFATPMKEIVPFIALLP
ncbi:MAG: hypothetical protein EOM67_07185 [Spirochaetia bacterium]|nr:hypothetical protein [Spirochaetia bacterium]